jgi:outer membrane protein
MQKRVFFLIACLVFLTIDSDAQQAKGDGETGNHGFSLNDCIRYALKNQPAIHQSSIDEAIARANNNIALSNWLPQISGMANLQHYFQLPTAFSNTSTGPVGVSSGLYNYSIPQIAATQTIFGTDALLAVKASKLNTLQVKQNTTSIKSRSD